MKKKPYDVAVYIGRFQPFHNGHKTILEKASKISNEILVLVGSVNKALNIKNPFTFEERKSMIPTEINGVKIKVKPLKDFVNDGSWVSEVQSIVAEEYDDYDEDLKIAIVGCEKDSSTYYLKTFIWDFVGYEQERNINATYIRERLFENPSEYLATIPNSTQNFLLKWTKSETYKRLKDEYEFIKHYKSLFDCLPYPPIFVTTDAVVFCKGHVLLVKRKSNPGKGLWALPGGFVKDDQNLKESAIRELKEETKIKVYKADLRNSIKGVKVFDSPDRSLRGRTITHAFYFHLNLPKLPYVKGSDDAEFAKWVSLYDFFENYETQMFEDHYDIVSYFFNRYIGF